MRATGGKMVSTARPRAAGGRRQDRHRQGQGQGRCRVLGTPGTHWVCCWGAGGRWGAAPGAAAPPLPRRAQRPSRPAQAYLLLEEDIRDLAASDDYR